MYDDIHFPPSLSPSIVFVVCNSTVVFCFCAAYYKCGEMRYISFFNEKNKNQTTLLWDVISLITIGCYGRHDLYPETGERKNRRY